MVFWKSYDCFITKTKLTVFYFKLILQRPKKIITIIYIAFCYIFAPINNGMSKSFKTISAPAETIFKEKRSKFLAFAFPVLENATIVVKTASF